MKAPLKTFTPTLKWLGPLCISLILAGCATAPAPQSVSFIQQQIAEISSLTGEPQASAIITAMNALNRRGDYTDALKLADQFSISPTLGTLFISAKTEQMLAAVGAGRFARALEISDEVLSNAQLVPTLVEEARLIRLRVDAFDGLGDLRSALEEQVYLSFIAPLEDEVRLRIAIWNRAQQIVQLPELEALGNSDADGWIALAQAAAMEGNAALRQWQREWPNHPALRELPIEVTERLATGWPTPRIIGAILPLSGPLIQVGENVLDGMLEQQLLDPSVTLIAVDGAKGLSQAIAELSAQNVDLIVGPLPKDQVNQMAGLNAGIPTLLLNYSAMEPNSNAPIAQMGLAPEDAGADAARLMASPDKRPIVFTPGDELGQRVTQAFAAQWAEQSDTQPIIARYLNDNQREVVAEATGVQASQNRHRQLERLLGSDLEFTPRRRQDMSGVYIYGDAVTAAQIKPLLAFYYSGELPVWLADSVLDRDLDLVRADLAGARVIAMPWQINSLADSNVLYELGADAWSVANQLAQNLSAPDGAVDGRTGLWTLKDTRLQRQLTPAVLGNEGITPIDRPDPAWLQQTDKTQGQEFVPLLELPE